ncbi:hypothetical protein L596_018765 [Steinernema carpocapsae]|uniref:Protein kinase domain-containing protein n=1 Tax=Steinernema carpocapsae TaxID=34508 RepID=A0A4V6XW49_STECR|nr:hypothetical protein L596_018765 [Steinernema carpocapsae]
MPKSEKDRSSKHGKKSKRDKDESRRSKRDKKEKRRSRRGGSRSRRVEKETRSKRGGKKEKPQKSDFEEVEEEKRKEKEPKSDAKGGKEEEPKSDAKEPKEMKKTPKREKEEQPKSDVKDEKKKEAKSPKANAKDDKKKEEKEPKSDAKDEKKGETNGLTAREPLPNEMPSRMRNADLPEELPKFYKTHWRSNRTIFGEERIDPDAEFGCVYRVSDETGTYALKLEKADEAVPVLRMEVFVLTELRKRGGSRHFTIIHDKGQHDGLNFCVMTLCGPSLLQLRKEHTKGKFSLGCGISIAIQCLEALEDLHSVGYIHRDVSPANFTIGRSELKEERKIYMLDFGFARKYIF